MSTDSELLSRIVKCQQAVSDGKIDLRDVNEILFGKWDQDWIAKVLAIARNSLEGNK